ncbi:hypothetical protein QZH45_20585 [Pseudomonas corrugata]|uniref:Uncharacterized protein n=1 Tax=Pseudomonas corrugata TaxID=47879 RepID=A0A3M3ENC4_9PSED|nr:hypothetical protein [Pseudomonas corrugata]AOE61437.1 hypothetical protein AXG94_06550 [Pseudomonas corrugata]MDU9025864.1 hypothetical protein [Pseudomonas corrugata]MDU9035714.1 hypothetical protein [Pseudomonas corrugata]MDU9041817.1 hypothetical protein [Pseudomonas corrugata]QTH12665.1 hypothetical protein C4C32_19055 [Pseudomonas corrugata]
METSKGILITLTEKTGQIYRAVEIDFVTRMAGFVDDDPDNEFHDSIISSYSVRVSRTEPEGPFNEVSVHGDIDGDNDVDADDRQALIDLAIAASKVPAPI